MKIKLVKITGILTRGALDPKPPATSQHNANQTARATELAESSIKLKGTFFTNPQGKKGNENPESEEQSVHKDKLKT